MKIISLARASCLALVLCLPSSMLATVVEKKSFADLVRQADMIAIGQVMTVESHPTRDQQYAYTYVIVGRLEILKGTYRQRKITLRMDGGWFGNDQLLSVHGIPEFQPGEKVVLFIQGNGQHMCPLVGWEQGLLRVVRDQQSGQEVLKTSAGLKIHTIEKSEFVIASSPEAIAAEASAGIPDYGQAQDPKSQAGIQSNAILTLENLKKEVTAVLAKVDPKTIPRVEVKSADLMLDSPGLQTAKPYQRED